MTGDPLTFRQTPLSGQSFPLTNTLVHDNASEKLISISFALDVHSPQGMNSNIFGDLLMIPRLHPPGNSFCFYA